VTGRSKWLRGFVGVNEARTRNVREWESGRIEVYIGVQPGCDSNLMMACENRNVRRKRISLK